MLPLIAAIPLALIGAPPAADHRAPRPLLPLAPRPERPDDGLLGKGKFEVDVKLPPEVLALIAHVDEDRDDIAAYVEWGLWLATAATAALVLVSLRYVVSGWRRPAESRHPWR